MVKFNMEDCFLLVNKFQNRYLERINECKVCISDEDILLKRIEEPPYPGLHNIDVRDPDNKDKNRKSKYLPKDSIVCSMSIYCKDINYILKNVSNAIIDAFTYINIPKEHISLNNRYEIFIKNKKICSLEEKVIINDSKETCTYLFYVIYCKNNNLYTELIKELSTKNTYGFISDFIEFDLYDFANKLDTNLTKFIKSDTVFE